MLHYLDIKNQISKEYEMCTAAWTLNYLRNDYKRNLFSIPWGITSASNYRFFASAFFIHFKTWLLFEFM